MTINILKPPTITDTHIYFTKLEVDWDGVSIDRLSVHLNIFHKWYLNKFYHFLNKEHYVKERFKRLKKDQKSLIEFTLNKMNNVK